MYYIICYDISDDKRRYRISKQLKYYGNRVQESVFEIYIRHERDLLKLQTKLKKIMQETDDIRFYYFPEIARPRSLSLSGQKIAYFPSSIIL